MTGAPPAADSMSNAHRESSTGGVPRILFAISDTGGGHRSGAQAIAAAIEQRVGHAVETYIIDIFTHTGVPVVRDAPVVYDKLSTRWLSLYDTLYRLTDGRRRIDALTKVVYFAAHRNIFARAGSGSPDAGGVGASVAQPSDRQCTPHLPPFRFRFITVVTDLVSLHASWADPDAELCIVPTKRSL